MYHFIDNLLRIIFLIDSFHLALTVFVEYNKKPPSETHLRGRGGNQHLGTFEGIFLPN